MSDDSRSTGVRIAMRRGLVIAHAGVLGAQSGRTHRTSWPTCDRDLDIREYHDSHAATDLVRQVAVLKISMKGVQWVEGYEQAWHSPQKR
jgi:hypothetical protein